MNSPCGGGSVIPMTTAVASSARIAFSASFRATPNDAHAATGASDGPTILPIIEICAAEMFAMFQRRFGDTAAHGSAGHPHFLFRVRMRCSFCRMVVSLTLPVAVDGGTGSDWMV